MVCVEITFFLSLNWLVSYINGEIIKEGAVSVSQVLV